MAKSQTIVVYLNKEKRQHWDVTFDAISDYFPVAFNDTVSGVKTFVDWEDEIGQFVLDINGEPYENYAFLDSTFNLDDTQIKTLSASISLNKKVIFEGGGEWQPTSLQFAIWERIDESEPITSIEVYNVGETTTATMNEVLGLLFMQENIP